MTSLVPFAIAVPVVVLAALAAYRLRALTVGGGVAAAIVGSLILGFGGWGLGIVLGGFFVSSSALTRVQRGRKSQPEHRRAGGRSASQVLANGLLPAGLAVLHGAFGTPWALPAAVGAVAASTADTWATEVGLLSRTPPRLITTGETVQPGRSGGVTVLGTAAGVAGATAIGLLAARLLGFSFPSLLLAGSVAFLADSVLGATLQVRYSCPACGRQGEDSSCVCGEGRLRAGGIPWITNDIVNFLATFMAAVLAGMLR